MSVLVALAVSLRPDDEVRLVRVLDDDSVKSYPRVVLHDLDEAVRQSPGCALLNPPCAHTCHLSQTLNLTDKSPLALELIVPRIDQNVISDETEIVTDLNPP